MIARQKLEVPPTEGCKSTEPVRELRRPRYPWQQKVMEAFQSPLDSSPANINIAERAIAGRLKDENQPDTGERLALNDALQSLDELLADIQAKLVLGEKEDIA
jgi:hypothetical protein